MNKELFCHSANALFPSSGENLRAACGKHLWMFISLFHGCFIGWSRRRAAAGRTEKAAAGVGASLSCGGFLLGYGSNPVSRVLLRREAAVCHLSKPAVACGHYRSTLRRSSLCASGGQPSSAGLRELSTSRLHSTHVAMRLVSSCLTFSPLPPVCVGRNGGGCFLLQVSLPSRTTFVSEGDCPVLPGLSSRGRWARQRQTGLLPYVLGLQR